MSVNRPLEDPPQPCYAARRAARAITQLFDLVLAPTGLKASQYIILRSIAEHGEVAQCSLSREHALSVETLSRRLGAMRKAGWVTLRISECRREHLYRLTEEGARLLSDAGPFWSRAQDRLSEAHHRATDQNLLGVIAVLDALTAAAQQGAMLRTTNGSAHKSAKAGQS